MTNAPRPPRPSLPFLVLGLLGAVGLLGPVPAKGDEAVRIVVRGLDDQPMVGPLQALDGTGVDLEVGGRRRHLDLDRIVAVEFPPAPPGAPPAPGYLRIALVGGESLLGSWLGKAPDGLRIDLPGTGPLTVPFDAVRTIVPVPPDSGPCYEPEHRHPAADANDVVYTTSGDAFQGILLGALDDGFELETEAGRSRVIRHEDVLVVHLQNPAPEPAAGLVVEIETVTGARLLAAGAVTLDGDVLRFALRSLPELALRLALSQVRTLRTSGGRFAYATEIPFRAEFVPYYRDDETEGSLLERWYAARVDRRPTGCPLRLGGTTYRHGFAVHSRSRVRLALDGEWARFRAEFGVDDEALEIDAGGIVDARVLADGRVVWEAQDVRAGLTPRKVGPLDVAGVKELVLEVDYGAELHVRDRASWVDPILERP